MKTQIKYKFAVIATDVVIFTIKNNDLNVLLIQMKKKPFIDMWAMPGGLVNPGESVDDSAKRNLSLKAGVKDIFLEQLYTFGDADRDPFGRVVSVAYFALIQSTDVELKTTKDYKDVAWFSVKKLPKMAYDHKEVLALAIERLKSKLEYTNIACNLLPNEFTLTELQDIYEIILDKKLDKRNFRKKILSLKLIKTTGRKRAGGANRPAELFKFIDKKVKIVNIL